MTYDHIKDDPQYPAEKYNYRISVKCYNCNSEFWYSMDALYHIDENYYCTSCRLKGEHHRIIRIYHRIKAFLR